MSLRTRIWSIPAAAVLVFGISLAFTLSSSTETAKTIGNLAAVDFPRLAITQRLEQELKSVVDGFQSAVAEGDKAKLADVERLATAFQKNTDDLAVLAGEKDEAQRLRSQFDAYVAAARDASSMMLGGKSDNAQSAIAGMQKAHDEAVAAVSAGFTKAQTDLRASVDASAAGVHRIVTTTVAGALIVVTVLAVISFFIAGSIITPLGRAKNVAESVAAGRLDNEIETSRQDEIGQVLTALQAMQIALREAAARSADDQGQIAAIGKAQAVIEFDMDGTVRMANENFLKMVGYGLADVKGQHHRMFVDPVYQSSGDYRSFWDKLGRGQYDAGQYKRLGRGGREVWLQASYNPILGVDGKPYKVVWYASDITEQVKMREALDSAVKETQSVVEAAIDGNLTSRIATAGKSGQIETLVSSINALVDNMMKVVSEIKRTASEVHSGAEEISRGNTDLSQRTEEQASSLEETASSMEQMTSTVKNNADNAAQANQLASAAREQAERGGSVVGAAVVAMGEINASSKRIADIISVIDEIAFQTNLLALNAAVEAARAGEQGRGFAVVASEVRNLASRSAEAAKEIKTLIQDSVGKVTEGTKLVDESGKALAEIVLRVKKVTDVMAEIASSSREQASGIEQVNKAITMMDEVTQQNAALVEEASAAAQALTEQASNLTQLISRYEVGEGSAEVAPHSAARPATAAPATERRGPNRPLTGKKRPVAVPKPAPVRAASAGGEEQWKDF
jgi:methyl-accepting chemotaxis protein